MNATSERTYNGWANYETWNAKLWLDNDEGSSSYWAEQADNAYTLAENEDEAARRLARQLKDELNEAMPDLGASCWADLLNAALSEVDWLEIAESYVSEAKERASE